jgi:hypothetical protein
MRTLPATNSPHRLTVEEWCARELMLNGIRLIDYSNTLANDEYTNIRGLTAWVNRQYAAATKKMANAWYAAAR